MSIDPIPPGADPIWQPSCYLQGCSGWVALTAAGDQIVPLHPDPTEPFRGWIKAHPNFKNWTTSYGHSD